MSAGASGSAAGLSEPLALALLLPMEAGVPITVVAAAVSGLSGRRALPALIVGSSVFLLLHLVLGLLLGPLADQAFDQAKGRPWRRAPCWSPRAWSSGGSGAGSGRRSRPPGRKRPARPASA